jgi:integrase
VSHIEDRWFRTIAGPDGKPVKEKRARHDTGRRWRVRYEDLDGRERSRSFDKKADAEAFKTEVDAALKHGTYHDPDAGRISLRKYAEEWLEARRFDAVTREAVASRMRLHIYPALGGRRLDELASRPSLIEAWLTELQQARGERTLAASTVGKIFIHLNSVLRAAVLDGRISANPCARVTAPKPPKRKVQPWTPETAASVRAALPERIRAMVDAGTGLGLRQSEIFGLAVEEIDFLRHMVHVRQQVKLVGGRPYFAIPKGEKERHVPMAGHTASALAAHLAAFPAVEVTLPWHEPKTRRHGKPHTALLLFTTRAGRPLHRNGFNANTWRPAVQAAGLPDDRVNGCHMLRHVYASVLIARGIDVRTVAEFLGHSDGGALVLKTYSHLMPDAEDKTRRALEAALAPPGDFPSAVPQTAPRG